MKSKRLSLILVSAVIILTGMSCTLNISPSRAFRVEESLVGSWKSGYIYISSDYRYDYSCTYTFSFSAKGDMSLVTEYFLKDRTGSTWSKDYSKQKLTHEFTVFSHAYSDTDGYLTVMDRETLDVISQPEYRLSESGNVLLMILESGKKISLAKVVDSEL